MVLNSDKNWEKGAPLDLGEIRSVIDYKAQQNPKTPKTGKPLFHGASQCGVPEANSLLHRQITLRDLIEPSPVPTAQTLHHQTSDELFEV